MIQRLYGLAPGIILFVSVFLVSAQAIGTMYGDWDRSMRYDLEREKERIMQDEKEEALDRWSHFGVYLLIGIVIQAAVFGFFTGYLAGTKGYSQVAWFFLGFFFSLVAVIVAAGLPKKEEPSGRYSPKRSSPKTRCIKCGSIHEAHYVFCPSCGAKYGRKDRVPAKKPDDSKSGVKGWE